MVDFYIRLTMKNGHITPEKWFKYLGSKDKYYTVRRTKKLMFTIITGLERNREKKKERQKIGPATETYAYFIVERVKDLEKEKKCKISVLIRNPTFTIIEGRVRIQEREKKN